MGCASKAGYRKVVGPLELSVPRAPPFEGCCGGVLLSHTLPGAVPSALAGLASRFGMGAGRFPGAMTTTRLVFNTVPPPWFGGGCGLIVVCIVVAAVLLLFVVTRTCCLGGCLVLAH